MIYKYKTWRLLDTGIRTAAENITLDWVLLQAKRKKMMPNTLRFLQFFPPAVLVGFHQTIEQEVRIDFCKKEGIDINRRITGGGAIYFDESQLGWEIIADKYEIGFKLDDITKKLCQGVIAGLKKFGINAQFRGRNDIEVGGRKISGTGGVFEDGVFLFQGTLLIDFDIERMIKSLYIPVEKLKDKEIKEAKERVTWLKRELSYLPPLEKIKEALICGFKEVLKVEFKKEGLSSFEEELLEKKKEEFSSSKWIESIREGIFDKQTLTGSYKSKGGLIRVNARVDIKRRVLNQILITGDFFIYPTSAIFDLEASLKDISFDELEYYIFKFFKETSPQMIDLSPKDFLLAIFSAIKKVDYINLGIPINEINNIFCINGSLEDILAKANLLLLPYCAKLVDCEYRHKEGCGMCGRCSVGEAYKLAKRKNLICITIQSLNHLKRVLLNECKQRGVISYIGCCCQGFFNRQQEVFREAGIGGVLIDNIENSTCYELNEEKKAYLGKFERQTHLRIDLLAKILFGLKQWK